MKWTLFLIPFTALILYSVIRWFRFEKSNKKIVDNYKVIDVADLTIHWFYYIFGLLFILLFILSDDPNKKLMFFIISIACIILAFYNIVLQKLIHVNRFAYNDKELLVLGRRNTSIPLNEIQSISLNGFTNKIIIQGILKIATGFGKSPFLRMNKKDNTITLSNRFFRIDDLKDFMMFVDDEVGLNNIDVSINLKKLLNLEGNVTFGGQID